MLIVLPVCKKDEYLALLNLKLCAKWETSLPFGVLVAHEKGFDPAAVVAAAKELATNVEVFEYDPCPLGTEWPRPQNWAWQSVARHLSGGERREPWLWWEQDAVPCCKGWAQQLSDAYAKGGKLYGGSFVEQAGYKYLNGVAIYPWDAARRLEKALLARTAPWDVVMGVHDGVLHNAENLAPLLTHDFRVDGGGRPWKAGDYLPQGVALWHRCKTGELQALLLEDKLIPSAETAPPEVVPSLNFTGELMIGHTSRPDGLPRLHREVEVKGPSSQRILLIALEGTTGYGEIGQLRLHELAMAGHDVRWLPVSFDDSVVDSSAVGKFARAQQAQLGWEYDVVWAVVTPDTWDHWRRFYWKDGNRFVGETIWETDRLHPEWVQRMNRAADEVVASTKWNRDIFVKSGITKPVSYRPFQYPAEYLPPRSACTIEGLPSTAYLFYTIGQWTERKGVTETVRAFCEEFTKADDVALLVKTHWTNYTEGPQNVCRNRMDLILSQYPDHAPVLLNLESLPRRGILALHSRGDCYVSLCKSEGLGLGARDAHAFGKPVVITGWGGQVEVLGEGYPGLIKYSMTPVKGMDWIKAYLPTMKWALPDIGHARQLMREHYEHRAGIHR